MAHFSKEHGIPVPLIKALRKADVLTGQFLQPISPEERLEIEARGLVWSEGSTLNERGLAVRSWLMRGAPCALDEAAKLLTSPSLPH